MPTINLSAKTTKIESIPNTFYRVSVQNTSLYPLRVSFDSTDINKGFIINSNQSLTISTFGSTKINFLSDVDMDVTYDIINDFPLVYPLTVSGSTELILNTVSLPTLSKGATIHNCGDDVITFSINSNTATKMTLPSGTSTQLKEPICGLYFVGNSKIQIIP